MKKLLLLLTMLPVLFLPSCASNDAPGVTGSDAPANLSLSLAYRVNFIWLELTASANGVLMVPNSFQRGTLNGDERFLWHFNLQTMEAEIMNENYFSSIEGRNFATPNYYYCLSANDSLGANGEYTQTYTFMRFKPDDLENPEEVVCAPDTTIAFGFLLSDSEGSLYGLLYENESQPERSAYAGKIDFEKGKVEKLTTLDVYRSDYCVIGLSADSLLLRRASVPEKKEGGISDYNHELSSFFEHDVVELSLGDWTLTELENELKYAFYPSDHFFVDSYTNTAFIIDADSSLQGSVYWQNTVDFSEGVINFDLTPRYDFASQFDNIEPSIGLAISPIPRGSTENGYIIQLGVLYLDEKNIDALPLFGYVSREDYFKGDLGNISLFDYGILEELAN
ncbi:MAG: hypothetical protein Q4B42_01470 [Oscillospiraceae bacterium]|nr:hypothetical protein [Oscillospiraceae bacterium]